MENQSDHFNPVTFLYLLPVLYISLKLLSKLIKNHNTKLKLPPGPWRLPLIGNMHQFMGGAPHHVLRDMAGKYGSLMHVKFGELSFIVISTPETAKQVLKIQDMNFASRPVTVPMEVVLYHPLNLFLAPYGDFWRKVRKLCVVELLSQEKVRSFGSIRATEVAALVKTISDNYNSNGTGGVFGLINLSQMILSTTYQIVSNAAVGSRGQHADKIAHVIKIVNEATGNLTLVDLFPSNKLLHAVTGVRRKLGKIHREIDEVFEGILQQHKEERKARNYEMKDLLDFLLDIQDKGDDDDDSPLTDLNIKAILMDILLPGIETTATTMEWAMSELLRNPRVMEKAQVEVRQVFESKGAVNETDLHQLKYLKLIIKETLRVHPPVPLLIRQNSDKSEINGYDVPAKSRLFINVYAIGRDPSYWGQPERFFPERFNDSSVEFKGADFEFIPFGGGRRICPGMTFSLSSIELLLATLLYHFDWRLPDGVKPEELDMTEALGATVRRKQDLHVIPLLPNKR